MRVCDVRLDFGARGRRLQTLMADPNDTVRRMAAFGVGAAVGFLEPEPQAALTEALVRGRGVSGGAGGAGASAAAGAGSSGDWLVVHGQRMAVYGAVRCVLLPLLLLWRLPLAHRGLAVHACFVRLFAYVVRAFVRCFQMCIACVRWGGGR
jgi:hypothetical protein